MSSVSRRAAVRIALLLTAAMLILPRLAAADGDPASDTLLVQSVFYPYTPPVARAVVISLNAKTAAAKRAGVPIKVALIASTTDLGALPSLFGKPRAYARFLDQEISFARAQPLLVVMPAGYGVAGLTTAETRAVAALPKPALKTPTGLALAAETAIDKAMAASGRPLTGKDARAATATAGDDRSPGGGNTVALIVLALAAIAVSTGLIALRLRRPSA
jgi:hypothetical protein